MSALAAIQGTAVASATTKSRNNFDGLRLLAALCVVYFHQAPDPAGNSGLRLVMFFSISGFLLTGSWVSDPNVFRFLARRFLRVWPAFATVIVVCAAITWFFPVHDMPEISRIASSYYLSNLWLPGFDWSYFPGYRPVINQSLWMVPFEIDIYLAFTAVALLGRNARIVVSAVLLLLGMQAEQTVAAPGRLFECWSLYFSAFFAFGVLLREFPRLRDDKWIATFVAIGVALLLSGERSAGLLLVIPPGAVWIGLRSWPVLRSASRFGDLSYGIFLWSFPIQQVTFLWMDPHLPIAVQMAIVLLQVIPVAWLSRRLIETPAMRWKPRRASSGARTKVAFNAPAPVMGLVLKTTSLRNTMGWLMGLEPTTTGITTRDSTN